MAHKIPGKECRNCLIDKYILIDINELLKEVMIAGASDLHITVGIKPTIRLNGDLTRY